MVCHSIPAETLNFHHIIVYGSSGGNMQKKTSDLSIPELSLSQSPAVGASADKKG